MRVSHVAAEKEPCWSGGPGSVLHEPLLPSGADAEEEGIRSKAEIGQAET